MYKITIERPGKTNITIETENAVVVYDNILDKNICILESGESPFTIPEMITKAKTLYVKNACGKDETVKRASAMAITDLMGSMEFKSIIKEILDKLEKDKEKANPLSSDPFKTESPFPSGFSFLKWR